MFCPKCGKENPDNNQLCEVCRANLMKGIKNRTVFAESVIWIIIGILFGLLARMNNNKKNYKP